MTIDRRRLVPSLGGGIKEVNGREPGLSQRSERAASVAMLIERLETGVAHERYEAVLGLVDYPDHPRAVGGILRAVQSDGHFVSLAAIFALRWIVDRLADDRLRAAAIRRLRCILIADPPLRIRLPALRVLRAGMVPPMNWAGRALWTEINHCERLGTALHLADAAVIALTRIGTPEALAAIAAAPPNSQERISNINA